MSKVFTPFLDTIRVWITARRVSFCTRHMPNDIQSQSTFVANPSKDMLKYDQPVKEPMI